MRVDLAIVGAGTMGAGIAQVAATRGLDVVLYDSNPAALERGLTTIYAALGRGVERGRLSIAEHDAVVARLTAASALADLAAAPIVVEAVPEDLALKQRIFADLDSVCAPATVLATNTSSISITRIAAATTRPERVVGMHFFNPVWAMTLVEVVAGELSGEPAAAAVVALARRMGRTPVRVKDTPGFVVNRVARPYYGEALRLLAEGIDVAQTDRILRTGSGLPMGPFELMDLIGIDVNFAVTRSIFDAFFGEPRYRPHPIQDRMVAAGTLGRKTGRGFYPYGRSGGEGQAQEGEAAGPAPGTRTRRGGRVYVAGAAGDALLGFVEVQLAAAGYTVVLQTAGDAGAERSSTLSLAPVVAGLDLWRVLGEERAEAIAGLDESLPPGRPLLSLCNAASTDELASYAVRGERVVGFSLFGPLREGMQAEILPGLGTETGAVQRAAGVLDALGFRTEVLPSGAWAILPRVLSLVINEAAIAVTEGVASAADIDSAMRLGANYPQGPLALADEIGLGDVLAVLEALQGEYGDERYRPAPLLRRLVLAGYTGRAVGRGFHLY